MLLKVFHGLDGCESEWTPGDGDGQGGLVCCNSWGCKESDTTERLNWTELRAVIGLPWWLRQLRICPQCKRSRFNPWVRKIPWRREWLLTPVFLFGEFHGQRSLVGYNHGVKELDVTEQLTLLIKILNVHILWLRNYTSRTLEYLSYTNIRRNAK